MKKKKISKIPGLEIPAGLRDEWKQKEESIKGSDHTCLRARNQCVEPKQATNYPQVHQSR